MDNTKATNSQPPVILNLTTDESRIAIIALANYLVSNSLMLEANWSVSAYYRLTDQVKTAASSIRASFNYVQQIKGLLQKLEKSAEVQVATLSDSQLRLLGFALYDAMLLDTVKAMEAVDNKLSFDNVEAQQRCRRQLLDQSMSMIELYKRILPTLKERGIRHMQWPQPGIELPT